MPLSALAAVTYSRVFREDKRQTFPCASFSLSFKASSWGLRVLGSYFLLVGFVVVARLSELL